jgi:uncharacterized damage-inducible protein DinB
MIGRREQTWKLLHDKSFEDKWFIQRPTKHQWSIDEILRHMLANEVRYLQMPLNPDIEQHKLAVLAQWVGNILFRIKEGEHFSINIVQEGFEDVQNLSQNILEDLTEEDLNKEVKAPWGEMISYGSMLTDLFDHDQFHRGQVHHLITYFRGPPKFVDPPNNHNLG